MANGPPSEKFSPLAQTSGYATDCGGDDTFRIAPGRHFPKLGPCPPPTNSKNSLKSFCEVGYANLARMAYCFCCW